MHIGAGENLNPSKTCLVLILTVLCNNLCADDLASVEIRKVSPCTWTHTSYEMIDGYRIDSNGLLIDCSDSVVLVDTCWNDKKTRTLLQSARDLFHKPIVLAIITHAHSDRIGGIRELLSAGIRVVSTTLIAKDAADAGFPAPTNDLDPTTTELRIGGVRLVTYYPGPGHTKGNIVVWIPKDLVLFGGCLIKSRISGNLGNIADADLKAWGPSVQNLKERYPDAMVVVPGHGQVGGFELLQHAINLCPKN